jgi:hypothetical protein
MNQSSASAPGGFPHTSICHNKPSSTDESTMNSNTIINHQEEEPAILRAAELLLRVEGNEAFQGKDFESRSNMTTRRRSVLLRYTSTWRMLCAD